MSEDPSETSADSELDDDIPGILLTREINKAGRLPVPEKLRPLLYTDYPSDEANTFWGYEESMNLAVLSKRWPTSASNNFVGSYDLNDGSWVHIADEIAEETEVKQEAGDIVCFFTYGGMMDEGEAYVLSERQMWRLVPEDELPDTGGMVERVIEEAPAFMSSVR